MRIKIAVTALALSVTSLANANTADDVKDAVEYRQSAFQTMSWHFGHISAMAKGEIDYDADEFEKRATYIASLAKMPWEGFVEGSYLENPHGIATSAKEGDKAEMQRLAKKMMKESTKLADVAKEGDFAQSRKQFAAVAKTCKSCHDSFKAQN